MRWWFGLFGCLWRGNRVRALCESAHVGVIGPRDHSRNRTVLKFPPGRNGLTLLNQTNLTPTVVEHLDVMP